MKAKHREHRPKSIALIGVPMDLGADRRGVDMGPSALRCAGIQQRLESIGCKVKDMGDMVVRHPPDYGAEGNTAKFLAEITSVSQKLSEHVFGVLEEGTFPLVLGGDHSISIGTMKGAMKRFSRMGVIWFDAHSDVNTPDTTPTGNIHGMPLAVALGFGHPELTAVGGIDRVILPQDVVIIGARSIDPGERRFLRELQITVFTMHDIDRLGMSKVMDEAIARVTAHTDGVHLSLDLDGLDPGDAPGVGTPVYGGITYREGHLAMELLAEAGIVTSAELVEVNPILDTSNRTAEAAVALAASFLGEKIL